MRTITEDELIFLDRFGNDVLRELARSYRNQSRLRNAIGEAIDCIDLIANHPPVLNQARLTLHRALASTLHPATSEKGSD